MVSEKKLANVVGGKTARACDNCIAKRARWYCAADDAFLCQVCDASVHSANPLAKRHERVRLKTSSLKSLSLEDLNSPTLENFVPSWQKGLTKKPRTPRQGKQQRKTTQNWNFLVPEFPNGETSNEENDEQLLYRVPNFDYFAEGDGDDKKTTKLLELGDSFLPSEVELAEFAADVESLLGKGLDEESFDMESLGLLDHQNEVDDLKDGGACLSDGRVKVEDEVGNEIDMTREAFQFNFDFDGPETHKEGENFKVESEAQTHDEEEEGSRVDEEDKSCKKMLLRLDYGAVMDAWSTNERSPWTTGDRPELDSSECWPSCLGNCGKVHHNPYGGDIGGISGHNRARSDGGREARVSRYREKRRTRLFSKKIRYEVRKLNAEKRPRMKGRFVKRTNFAATTSFPLLSK